MSRNIIISPLGQEALREFFMNLDRPEIYERVVSMIDKDTGELDQRKHKTVKPLLMELSHETEVDMQINDNGYRQMTQTDFRRVASLIDSSKTDRLFNILCGGFNIPEVAKDCGVSRQAMHEQYVNFLSYAYALNKTSRWLRDLRTQYLD